MIFANFSCVSTKDFLVLSSSFLSISFSSIARSSISKIIFLTFVLNNCVDDVNSLKRETLDAIHQLSERLTLNDYKTDRNINWNDSKTWWRLGILGSIITLILGSVITNIMGG